VVQNSCMLQPTSTEPASPAFTPEAAQPGHAELDERIEALQAAVRALLVTGKRQRYAGALDKAAITVLHLLSERQPARASDLANSSGLDASTISRHIKGLIDAGYIDLHPDPEDARARILTLSTAGHDTLARAQAERLARTRAALADWAPQDIDTLTTLLRRLSAALEHEDS